MVDHYEDKLDMVVDNLTIKIECKVINMSYKRLHLGGTIRQNKNVFIGIE